MALMYRDGAPCTGRITESDLAREPRSEAVVAWFDGACGKSWTGLTRGHCSGCHEVFVASAFDKHQRISGGVLTCLPPETVGLIARDKPWGRLWGMPGGYWDNEGDG